jgi:hypothetical protein
MMRIFIKEGLLKIGIQGKCQKLVRSIKQILLHSYPKGTSSAMILEP